MTAAPRTDAVVPLVSVISPVYDEADTVRELAERVRSSLDAAGVLFELLLVDDGSRDASWREITAACATDPAVRGLRHRGNFGKAAALATGLRHAVGSTIVTIDSDLQDDPEEIPKLLDALDGGLDLVSGWKEHRQDPWTKRVPSRLFNKVTRWVSKVHLRDFNCGLKAARAEVFRAIPLYGELHRFVPVLASGLGYRVGELPVRHHRRLHGRSKYGIERLVRGFLDLFTVVSLTRFDRRPGHLFGSLGLIFGGLGGISLAYLAVVSIVSERGIGNRPLLFAGMIGVLFGAQLLSLGVLAELILHRTSGHEDPNLMSDFYPPVDRPDVS